MKECRAGDIWVDETDTLYILKVRGERVEYRFNSNGGSNIVSLKDLTGHLNRWNYKLSKEASFDKMYERLL